MKQHHRSASPYEGKIGFSRAVRAGDRILVSGGDARASHTGFGRSINSTSMPK